MIIYFGQKYFGKVDELPGKFYVVTLFTHAWWLPIMPVQSVLMVHGRQDPIAIPLRWKSVLLTWARVGLGFCMMLGSLIINLVAYEFLPRHSDLCAAIWFFLMLGGFLATYLIPQLRLASPMRALELEAIATGQDPPGGFPVDMHQ